MKTPTPPNCPAHHIPMALYTVEERYYYGCKTYTCTYTCGTYHHTKRPFGIPADKPTRELRSRAKQQYAAFLDRVHEREPFADDRDRKRWHNGWLHQEGFAKSPKQASFSFMDRKTVEALINRLVEIEQDVKAGIAQ